MIIESYGRANFLVGWKTWPSLSIRSCWNVQPLCDMIFFQQKASKKMFNVIKYPITAKTHQNLGGGFKDFLFSPLAG